MFLFLFNCSFYLHYLVFVGYFFLGGLVRKDLILEFFFLNFWFLFILILFLFSVYVTFFYSYRLWKRFFSNFNFSFIYCRNSFILYFLSLLVCVNSIFFIWWLILNFTVLPMVFLYIDFCMPLFFLFFIFFLFRGSVKIIFIELSTKFLVDFLSKFFVFFLKDYRFLDNILYYLSKSSFSFLIVFRGVSNFYIFRNFYSSLVILVFLLFIFF